MEAYEMEVQKKRLLARKHLTNAINSYGNPNFQFSYLLNALKNVETYGKAYVPQAKDAWDQFMMKVESDKA